MKLVIRDGMGNVIASATGTAIATPHGPITEVLYALSLDPRDMVYATSRYACAMSWEALSADLDRWFYANSVPA